MAVHEPIPKAIIRATVTTNAVARIAAAVRLTLDDRDHAGAIGQVMSSASDVAEVSTEMEQAKTDADSAKSSLLGVQSEIRKLQGERDSMLAKMQSAQARIKVQEQLDGLSVDAEVKALDNVRQHIKTTIAEANLGKELSESSLDSRLASLRTQTGDVQAKQQLAELKAKKAAQQAQTNKTM